MLLLLTLSARGTAQEAITLHKGKKHTYAYIKREDTRLYAQSKYLAQDTIRPKYLRDFYANPWKGVKTMDMDDDDFEFITIDPPEVNFSAGAKETLLDLLVEHLAPELMTEYGHIQHLEYVAERQNKNVHMDKTIYIHAFADMGGRIIRIGLVHGSYSSMIIPVGKFEQFEEAVLKSGVRLEYDKRDDRFRGSTVLHESKIYLISEVYDRLQEKTKDKSSKYYGMDFSYLEDEDE